MLYHYLRMVARTSQGTIGPLSFTSVVGKVLEGILKDRLYNI